MLSVASSMSTKTGFAPRRARQDAEAKKRIGRREYFSAIAESKDIASYHERIRTGGYAN